MSALLSARTMRPSLPLAGAAIGAAVRSRSGATSPPPEIV